MIIEWNTHIFHPDQDSFPLHPCAFYKPEIPSKPIDPLTDYIEKMRGFAIDRAVLVHPEPYGDDHRVVLDCLEREPNLFVATSLFYPGDAAAPDKLQDLVEQQPKIVSTRFHAYRNDRKYFETFQDAGVRALWAKAAELGLIVELHITPPYASQAAALIQEFGDTTVLIDHLAEPKEGNAVEFADVLVLSQFDHVYMKLSGLSHFSDDEPLYESVRPFTRRIIETFGPERMVWGSGIPDIVDVHMEKYSVADRALVKGGNLQRLLGL